MALDEDPTSTATYWPSLAASQTAGTSWTCRRGESNPGDYDTCHFCQRVQPDSPPSAPAGSVFTPTVGEDGDAVAVTWFRPPVGPVGRVQGTLYRDLS